jgi:DHA2 family multidrug resistance protein-like MFS transporter
MLADSSVSPSRAGRREWIGLAVIALPCLLYSMDLTVLNLAVPQLSSDLKPTSAQLLWIVDIYGFVLAGLLIPMGTIGDRIGRRRLLLIGAAAFGAASVLAAFSRSAEMLIAARALLGIAGATLAPSTLSLIRNMFADSKQRTVAISVWITSYSAGGAIGPLLGGVLLEHFWWGSVFLIGVPVMVLLLVVGPVLLPEFRDPNAGRIDLVSAALSLAAVLLIIYGIKQFAQGTAGYWPALPIGVGALAGVVFIRRQKTLAHPLVDLELFRARSFSMALTAYTVATFVAFGLFFFIGQYMQLVLKLSPLQAGFWELPFFASFIVGSMVSPVMARHARPAILIASGLAVSALGFLMVAQAGASSGLAMLVGGIVVYCLGLAPVFTLATDVIVGAAPPERAGAASAISETGSELGGALGIAVLGSIGTAVYRSAMAHGVPDAVPAAAHEVVRGTLGGAVSVATNLSDGIGAELVAAAHEAFSRAMTLTALLSAFIVLTTAVSIAVMLRRSAVSSRDAGLRSASADNSSAPKTRSSAARRPPRDCTAFSA